MMKTDASDPYIGWLEDKDGAKPLAWVEAENAKHAAAAAERPALRGPSMPRRWRSRRRQRPHPDAGAAGRRPRLSTSGRDAEHPHGHVALDERGQTTRPPHRTGTTADRPRRTGQGRGQELGVEGPRSASSPRSGCASWRCRRAARTRSPIASSISSPGAFVRGRVRAAQVQAGCGAGSMRDTLLVCRATGARGTMTASSYPFVAQDG